MRERAGGPLRVLVEGQPSLWFKGVHDAVAAVRAMEEPAELTVLAPDPGESGGLEGVAIAGGLHPAAVADVYADHDVVLKLSRVEGLPLCPLEAFHLALPAIVTPFTGHEEYLVHGHNGLVAGFDDGPEIFSRTVQSTIGIASGVIALATAMGALVAVAYLVLHGRFRIRLNEMWESGKAPWKKWK